MLLLIILNDDAARLALVVSSGDESVVLAKVIERVESRRDRARICSREMSLLMEGKRPFEASLELAGDLCIVLVYVGYRRRRIPARQIHQP